MLNKKVIGATAFAAALAGGGLAGALLGTPSVSGAQETPTTAAPADEPAGPFEGPGFPGRGGPRGDVVRPSMEVVASQLGITVDELRTALRDGSTVADLAAENGVDLDGLIAAVVADASARIDQAVADGDLPQERADELESHLEDLVTRFVNGELRDHGPGFGHGGPGGPAWGRMATLDAAADAIGVTVAELREELESGKTVAQVAEEHGVDVQTVIDAMVDEATAHLTERITNFVNGVSPEGD